MNLESRLMNLDEYQKSIVTSKNDLLVIAGPGSGKTTTIMHKVNYIYEHNPQSKILLISFTNKSVDDLKKKIKVPSQITTFHKLAMDILEYNHITYSLATPYMLDYLIKEYLKTLNKKEQNELAKYLKIPKLDENNPQFISLCNLIKTFINLFKTNNHDYETIKKIATDYKDKYLITLIFKILYLYEEEKKSQNTFDFDDLIIMANKVLNKTHSYRKFDYIIVDEFQDTSLIRLNLIMSIYKLNKATITAVGDDAQSIFHFSGCDLNIFLNFQKYFPKSEVLFLKNTYRNSMNLVRLSEDFINKNPNQIVKNMQSTIIYKEPIKICYYYNPKKILIKVLNKIIPQSTDIMILSRNKKDIYKYLSKDISFKDNMVIYKEYSFPFLTIHSSKGLEAEFVIILNVEDSIMGIPNKIEDHPILNYLNKEIDKFPYAEERRVFFVGITRCKKETFLLVPRSNPSKFIKELKKSYKALKY